MIKKRHDICVHFEIWIDRSLQMKLDILHIEPLHMRVMVAEVQIVFFREHGG